MHCNGSPTLSDRWWPAGAAKPSRQHRDHRRSHPTSTTTSRTTTTVLSEDIRTITTKIVDLGNQLFDIQSFLTINISDAILEIKGELGLPTDHHQWDDEESESEVSSEISEPVLQDIRRFPCPAAQHDEEYESEFPNICKPATQDARRTVAPPPGLHLPDPEPRRSDLLGPHHRTSGSTLASPSWIREAAIKAAKQFGDLSPDHQLFKTTRTEPGAVQTPTESPAKVPEATASLAPKGAPDAPG